jgi:hypothetical protein
MSTSNVSQSNLALDDVMVVEEDPLKLPKVLTPKLVNERLDAFEIAFIKVRGYQNDIESLLSFSAWHDRKSDYWKVCKLGGGRLFPFTFLQWLGQGSKSFKAYIEKLDLDDIAREAELYSYNDGEEDASQKKKLFHYWKQHLATKWLKELLSAVETGPYTLTSAAQISDAVKSDAAMPYLEFTKRMALGTEFIEGDITHQLGKRRFAKSDHSSFAMFRRTFDEHLPVQLIGGVSFEEEHE